MLAGNAKYARLPKAKKTGTTIAGVQFKVRVGWWLVDQDYKNI